METAAIGNVVVPATIENIFDLKDRDLGKLSADQVRRLNVLDARVDTGATLLSLPRTLIQQLGLSQIERKPARTPTGPSEFGIYEPVRLTVQGRTCVVSVTEIHETCPVLIGFIALELLDFLVDPKRECLIGNPDHGGEDMIDML